MSLKRIENNYCCNKAREALSPPHVWEVVQGRILKTYYCQRCISKISENCHTMLFATKRLLLEHLTRESLK